MQRLCAVLVAFLVPLTLSAQLRSPAPAPAPAPAAAPGPASPGATMSHQEAIEEAHHQHTKNTVDRVLDQSAREMKEAEIDHSNAGVHVATAHGDNDSKKQYQEEAKDDGHDLEGLKKEAAESKATYQVSEAAYDAVEQAAHDAGCPGMNKGTCFANHPMCDWCVSPLGADFNTCKDYDECSQSVACDKVMQEAWDGCDWDAPKGTEASCNVASDRAVASDACSKGMPCGWEETKKDCEARGDTCGWDEALPGLTQCFDKTAPAEVYVCSKFNKGGYEGDVWNMKDPEAEKGCEANKACSWCTNSVTFPSRTVGRCSAFGCYPKSVYEGWVESDRNTTESKRD